jgi:hypothetical protein
MPDKIEARQNGIFRLDEDGRTHVKNQAQMASTGKLDVYIFWRV